MEHTLYKIGEVSAHLGLTDKNSNTLRSWSEEFGEYLSASVNPPAGQPRRFTRRDIQVLTAVRDYRANHLSYEEIRERLRAGEHDVTLPDPDEAPLQHGEAIPPAGIAPSQNQAVVSTAQVEALLAPLAASVEEWRRLAEEYRTRLEGREARIEILERRVEELYTRLDMTQHAPAAATAPPAPPAAAAATDSARAPSGAHTNGNVPATAPDDPPLLTGDACKPGEATAIFPLPIVEQAPSARQVGHDSAGQGASPKRPWWRWWRLWQ